jgi:CHASE2 domain-containing sensor protein/two-component sensor histidine kinase
MPPSAASLHRGRRLILEWALVALVSTLAIGWLAAAHVTVRADNVIYDALSRTAVRPPRDDIVIVAIDNRSIQDLGRWPWPRARHAALLDQLAKARPKLIAYDVLFLDPDADPANDQALAQAVKAAAPVILPLTFDVPGDNGAPFRLTPPVPPLRAAAGALAQVNLEFDPDGVVRRAMLAESDGHTVWPHMMESAYRLATGRDSPIYVKGQGEDAKAWPDGLLRSRPMLIPFAGPPGHFRTIAFTDVLKGETPPDFLKGKIVLVGATADGLGDRYSTPLSSTRRAGGSEVMAGVEVQANMLDALLSGRAIRPLGTPWVVALSLAPLWILLLGFLRLRPRANMVLGVVLMAACIALSAGLLLGAQVWAPPAAALAGLVLVYPLWSWRRLEVTSAYMMQELRRFADEPDVAPSVPRQPLGSDVVTRELNLMQGAVGRMRELRRFVADTLQGLPDATVVIDLEERVLMANRAADVLFETLIGEAPKGLPLWRLLDPFASDFGGADEELTAKGSTYQMRRIALHDTLERSVGWIVRFTDISALKAAARQREQVLQLLTHDMRSPQVSILALLDSPGEDKPSPNLARRIESYARRTLALADDFVHLARAESTVLDLEPLDLGDLITEAVDDLWPQSSARKIAVTARVGEGEPLVMADRSLMTRALINLIGNAVKYTEPGGRVDCAVSLEDGTVVCAISDTGRGMAPEQLERLFERFHRGGAAKSTDGVGLGLAFVQTVVERHGGQIACTSVEGQGSTFTLRFEAAPGLEA